MSVLVTKQGDRLHPSQMQRHESGFVALSVVTASGPLIVLTTELATAALTAGRNGTSVPSIAPTTIDKEGWINTTTLERNVIIIDEATGAPPEVAGDEIKGILTFAASVFAVTFASFSAVNVVVPGGTYTYYVPYRFSFENVPADSMLVAHRIITQDLLGGTAFSTDELLTIATLNTIPDVTIAPKVGSAFYLIVNGTWYHNLAGSPVVSFSGTSITWDEVEAGFDINPGDDVVAVYLV